LAPETQAAKATSETLSARRDRKWLEESARNGRQRGFSALRCQDAGFGRLRGGGGSPAKLVSDVTRASFPPIKKGPTSGLFLSWVSKYRRPIRSLSHYKAELVAGSSQSLGKRTGSGDGPGRRRILFFEWMWFTVLLLVRLLWKRPCAGIDVHALHRTSSGASRCVNEQDDRLACRSRGRSRICAISI
jgi:hypothetical protein